MTNTTMTSDKPNYFRLFLVVQSIMLSLRLLFTFTTPVGLFTEEAQYWLWSQNMDWSYYSKPAMIAVFNFVSTFVFGNTEFAIRLNAMLIGLAVAFVAYFFARSLFKSDKVAFWSATLLLAMPSVQMFSIYFMTDTPLMLFWLLCLWMFWEATETNAPKYWILFGIVAGLGFLSKFVIVLFAPMALFYLLLFKKTLFKEKWLYISVAIALLFLTPVLIWNFQNEFVTFKHVGTLSGVQSTTKAALTPGQRLSFVGEYVGGQLAYNSVFLLPFYIMALLMAFKKPWDKRLFYLALPIVSIFIFFLFISFNKRVEINWPAFAYMSLPLLTACFLSEKDKWKAVKWPVILSLAILPLFFAPYAFDWLGLNKVFPGKADPSARMYGYRQLADRVDSLKNVIGTERVFVFSNNYHIASELAFYLKCNPQTYCINNDGRRMNQFDMWPGVNQFKNSRYDGIYVSFSPTPGTLVKNAFEGHTDPIKHITVYRGDTVRTLYIHWLKEFKEMEQQESFTY